MRGMPASLVMFAALLLASCGADAPAASAGASEAPPSGSAYAAPAAQALSATDVQQIMAQAVTQAQADGRPAVISVVDRVGNVLALFRMSGSPANAHLTDAPNGQNLDAQGLDVPAEASAIAKAITGAYLSSSGNAFSTRTASAIIQQQAPPEPATAGFGSGPLYGVQFSQLPCSDLMQRFGASGGAAMTGPKRSPLGLAADPGGFPLYKNGVVVGGIGVEADGQYSYDADVSTPHLLIDERIALAGTEGFDAPAAITANMITIGGALLVYSEVTTGQLSAVTGASWASAAGSGSIEALTGYTSGAILAGTAYGSEQSGVRPATSAEFAQAGAYVLTDGSGNDRYPAQAGTDGADIAAPLTTAEVKAILGQAFSTMSSARAQLRMPLNSLAQMSISIVDTRGVALGLVRAPDAPVFGIDVALQKARTAAFLSNAAAGTQLMTNAAPRVAGYVTAVRSFLNNPNALTGTFAFSDRAISGLSRPTFPDGTVGNPNGPFSVTAAQFNPFATGLQSALIIANLAQHLGYVTGASPSDTPRRCTTTPDVAPGQNRIQNGIQIFAGSVPIYRGSVLVGGLGVSGDGSDQDDLTAFLGLDSASKSTGTIGNAPKAIRADQISVTLPDHTSSNLIYINCPQSPFVGSSAQTPCQGL